MRFSVIITILVGGPLWGQIQPVFNPFPPGFSASKAPPGSSGVNCTAINIIGASNPINFASAGPGSTRCQNILLTPTGAVTNWSFSGGLDTASNYLIQVIQGGTGFAVTWTTVNIHANNCTISSIPGGITNITIHYTVSSDVWDILGCTSPNDPSIIPASAGGTGQSSYTKGDILCAQNSSTLIKLAVGTDGQAIIADAASSCGLKYSGVSSAPFTDLQIAASSVVGTASDAVIYTTTVPANSIGAGHCIHIYAWTAHSTGAASPTYRLYWGGVGYDLVANGDTSRWNWSMHICNKPSLTNAQVITFDPIKYGNGQFFLQISGGLVFDTTAAVDTTASATLKLTFNVAATDQVTPLFWNLWVN